MSADAKKPTDLAPNTMPTDGYVLSVDGKWKTRYETSKEAMSAGSKLKENFPVVQISVFDASAQSYTPVDLPSK